MCGRFTLRTPAKQVAEHFGLSTIPSLEKRFNIAPTQPVLVIRAAVRNHRQPGPPREPEWVLLRWGLVPTWAKDPGIGSRLINARAETAASKPAFRTAFRRRRCLIPADGFYEWKSVAGKREPYFVRLRGDTLFAMAGLWESWEGADGSYLETCTVLTTDPNELLAPIHHRMPVILPPAEYHVWLSAQQADLARLQGLCRPFPADRMEAFPVSPMVNKPTSDDPRCIEPVRQ